MKVGQILYRAEFQRFASDPMIVFHEWKVIKVTPCGAWIVPRSMIYITDYRTDLKKWIGNNTRFVWHSRELAERSLLIRTQKWMQHESRRYFRVKQLYEYIMAREEKRKAKKPSPYIQRYKTYGEVENVLH